MGCTNSRTVKSQVTNKNKYSHQESPPKKEAEARSAGKPEDIREANAQLPKGDAQRQTTPPLAGLNSSAAPNLVKDGVETRTATTDKKDRSAQDAREEEERLGQQLEQQRKEEEESADPHRKTTTEESKRHSEAVAEKEIKHTAEAPPSEGTPQVPPQLRAEEEKQQKEESDDAA